MQSRAAVRELMIGVAGQPSSTREVYANCYNWVRASSALCRISSACSWSYCFLRRAEEEGVRAHQIRLGLKYRQGRAWQRRHLEDFLALFAETDYAWSAVCERRICLPAVERFLDDAVDSPLREPAQALLAAMRDADADPVLELSTREWEILSRLDAESDKAIAAELGLTTNGVRYHLRKLFSRLGATSRSEAVRRAREIGLFDRLPSS